MKVQYCSYIQYSYMYYNNNNFLGLLGQQKDKFDDQDKGYV